MASSTILAILKLNMPDDLIQERWSPREGTTVKLCFMAPGKLGSKGTVCSAVAIPDVFDLPYEGGCLFLVPAARFSFYSKFAVLVGQPLVHLPANLSLRVPQRGAQRQVDAINHLAEKAYLTKWRPLLLNHCARRRSLVDPTALLNPAAGVVMSKVQDTIGKLEWSERFPGTGKALTLVAMASILLSLRAHVIFTDPSHYAADAICESMGKWQRLTGEVLDPVRVYRPFSESRAYKTHGRPTAESTENDGDSDTDEFTSAKTPLEGVNSAHDDSFVPRVFSADAQLLIAELVKLIKADNFQKSYGLDHLEL